MAEAISACSADWPMVCSDAPELAPGVQAVRSFNVVWALVLIADSALCAVDRLVETRLLSAGQRLQELDLLLERQLVAGLVAELQAEIGVLAGRFLGHRRRQRRLRLHDRQDEAVGQELARDEVCGHRRHAALRRAENMLLTVVSSFADEA